MPCTAENRLRAVTPSSRRRSLWKQRRERPVDVAEQIHLFADRPFRNRLARRHPVLEQRAPEFEIFRGEIAIGDRDAHQRLARRGRAIAFGCGERGVEPRQRARSHPQDQFVHILDEIIDRAVGDADFPRQFPRLQARQSPRGDASFRRQDQCFREVLLVFPVL